MHPSVSDYLIPFASIVGLAWAATEGIGKVLTWPKPLVSVLTGVLLSAAFKLAGFIPDPAGDWRGWVLTIVVAAAAAIGAGAFNDYVVKAIFPGEAP